MFTKAQKKVQGREFLQILHNHLFNYKTKIKAMVNQVEAQEEITNLSKCQAITNKVTLIFMPDPTLIYKDNNLIHHSKVILIFRINFKDMVDKFNSQILLVVVEVLPPKVTLL